MSRVQALLFLSGLMVPVGLRAQTDLPQIAATARVDSQSAVSGRVVLGEGVFVGPFASIRALPGASITVAEQSNVQDGAVVLGGPGMGFETPWTRAGLLGVQVGARSTVAAQAQLQGPVRVGDDVMVGMKALIFNAEIGDRCMIEPGATVMGVRLPPDRYVPAALVVLDQAAADALPRVARNQMFSRLHEAFVSFYSRLGRAPVGGRTDD